jgi:hypothetical protein
VLNRGCPTTGHQELSRSPGATIHSAHKKGGTALWPKCIVLVRFRGDGHAASLRGLHRRAMVAHVHAMIAHRGRGTMVANAFRNLLLGRCGGWNSQQDEYSGRDCRKETFRFGAYLGAHGSFSLLEPCLNGLWDDCRSRRSEIVGVRVGPDGTLGVHRSVDAAGAQGIVISRESEPLGFFMRQSAQAACEP